MNGCIYVESTPGVGSHFWFALDLQLAADVAPTISHEQVGNVRFQSELSVLVAEDNHVNQRVAAALLQSFGLRVDVANNGIQAVEKCKNKDYALVLMDIQMPEMDGYEATRCIRTLNRPRVPIIALTAGASQAEERLALDAGMDGFVSKPVHRDELANTLGPFLANSEHPAPETSASVLVM